MWTIFTIALGDYVYCNLPAGNLLNYQRVFKISPFLDKSKTGTLEQQSRFALECDILFSPLSQLLNFPRVQSLFDRKYGHMDFFNVSPTFPYLLTSCCLHLQCRIEYIGLRSKKSGFSPHTLEVPLTTFIRNVQATWYAGRKNEKGAILGEKKGNLDLRITYPTTNQEILPYFFCGFYVFEYYRK